MQSLVARTVSPLGRGVAAFAVVASVLAALAAGAPTAAAERAQEGPDAGFCARSGADFGDPEVSVLGAAWGRAGDRNRIGWYLLASRTATCTEARRLLPEITRVAVSLGSVTARAFVVEGWRCLANRDLRVAGCSVSEEGVAKYVVAFPASADGRLLALGAYTGRGIDVWAPSARPRDGSKPAPVPDPDRYSGEPSQRCTAIAGAPWRFGRTTPAGWPSGEIYPSGQSGDAWRVWAIGGLSCLAAQGWVADLSPRAVLRFPGLGGLRADDQWSCLTGGGELPVGLCVRSTSPRGLFDPKGVVIYPDVASAYVPFRTTSYDGVWQAMLRFNAAAERSLTAPRVCLDQVVPAARWNVDGVSGTRWAIGSVGGYGCGLITAGIERLATFAAASGEPLVITGGVDGQWRCTRNAGARLRCYYPQTGTAFRVVIQPYPPGRSHQEVEQDVLRALR